MEAYTIKQVSKGFEWLTEACVKRCPVEKDLEMPYIP